MTSLLRLAPALAAALAVATLVAAQEPPALTALPNAAWTKTFRSAASEYEIKDGASAGDALWVVVGLRPRGELGGPQKLELWRIDARGDRVSTTDLSALPVPAKSEDPQSAFYGITALPSGDAAMVFQCGTGFGYVVVNQTGTVVANRTIAGSFPNGFIARVATSDGNVVAAGRQGSQGLMLTLRPSGDALSAVRIGGVAILHEAIRTADGYAALGSSLLGAAGEVWLGRVGVNGDVVSSTRLAGINPELARDPRGGGFALVYETDADQGRHVVVQGLTPALAPAWSLTLPGIVPGMRGYSIDPFGDADFLLAGEGPRSVPVVQRVAPGGRTVWRYEHKEPQAMMTRIGTSALIPWNGDVVVALTLTIVEPKDQTFEQRQIVTLARLRPR